MGDFDPYHKWLAIPPAEQPPNHYRLLGLRQFESDPDVIANAADRQMAHLRQFQTGQRAALSQKLLNEIASAKICLLRPEAKARYDARLAPPQLPPTQAAGQSPGGRRSSAPISVAADPQAKPPSARRPTSSTARGTRSPRGRLHWAWLAAGGVSVALLGVVAWLAFGPAHSATDHSVATTQSETLGQEAKRVEQPTASAAPAPPAPQLQAPTKAPAPQPRPTAPTLQPEPPLPKAEAPPAESPHAAAKESAAPVPTADPAEDGAGRGGRAARSGR